jgi:hypothetical protein
MLRMSAVAFGCLVLAASAFAMCCAAWYSRFSPSMPDKPNQSDRGRFRRSLGLAALLCATSSSAIYVAFLLLWAYSHSFDGRQPLGAAAIWVGLIFSFCAVIGGLFAPGVQRLLIVASALELTFLWSLAGAAGAAV